MSAPAPAAAAAAAPAAAAEGEVPAGFEGPKHTLAKYQNPTPANLALQEAAAKGDATAAVAALRDGACSNYYGAEGGLTAVHVAAQQEKADALKAILEFKPPDEDAALVAHPDLLSTVVKSSPLHFAAGANAVECIKVLMALEVPVDAPDTYGNTPLMLACAKNYAACARLIIKTSNVQARSKKGETPLHMALAGVISQGRGQEVDEDEPFELINVLIKDGADVNAQDGKGCTPLHLCLQMRPEDDLGMALVKLLLKSGADVKLKDESGKRASDVLKGRNFLPEVLKLLLQNERYIS